MFTAVLFTISKLRNQPSCPSTDGWIKKNVVYIYTVEYYSDTKNENYVICRKMDRIEYYQVKQNKPNLDKYYMFSLISSIELKKKNEHEHKWGTIGKREPESGGRGKEECEGRRI
jgi:hypothetical protein